jgi:hypothetical protein
MIQELEKKKTVLVLHHQEDAILWSELAPHLKMLSYCLPQTVWTFYTLPLPVMNREQAKRQAFFDDLSHLWLFVPCTSATLLDELMSIYQSDARIPEGLSRASIMPIPLRAVAGTTGLVDDPLAASSPGHERDQACVEIVSVMKRQIRRQDLRMLNILQETACIRLPKE